MPDHSRHLETCSPSSRNFTLIELLVVLAIVGVLIGIALPAFEKLAVGSGVDAATRMVAGQLRLTREYAITKRQTVAMLLPNNSSPASTDPLNTIFKPYFYVAFKPCVVTKSGSNWVWQSWIPNTKWEFLPSGTIIAEADGDVGDDESYQPWNDDFNVSEVHNVDINEDDGPDVTTPPIAIRAVIFKPTGSIADTGITGKFISLAEGFYDGTMIRDRNRRNFRIIEVDYYTGRITHRPR